MIERGIDWFLCTKKHKVGMLIDRQPLLVGSGGACDE